MRLLNPLLIAVCILTSATHATAQSPTAWKRHTIDGATDSMRGADGVRLADADGDGLMDTVTGWEEGKAIRVCINPGPDKVHKPWPVVTVGTVKSAEDAVFADLDGDGRLDVVSCTEGRIKTVYFHWAPSEPGEYLTAEAWKTEAVPITVMKQAWMFAVPMDIDGEHGIDLILGSKGKGGTVGWLQSPRDPRDVKAWTFHKIVDAGWIMSLRSSGPPNTLAPIYVTDRRGPRRGVYRLDPARTKSGAVQWTRHDIGGARHEVMFMDIDPTLDIKPRLLVATRNGEILELVRTNGATAGDKAAPVWTSRTIPNPFGIKHGKAVRIGDLNLDGRLEIVHTANTGRSRRPGITPGICWMQQVEGKWRSFDLSGGDGSKFDRIELLDLDGDGDLDLITCEENGGKNSRGLGLIWYENPTR